MDIRRAGDALELTELDPFLAELLRQIPESAKADSAEAARARLFCLPADPEEKEICAEWKLYVEPELRRLFQNATETVTHDLKPLNGKSEAFENCTLRIPAKNAEAWLSALNQARLAIAASYGFSEAELGDPYRSPIGSRRDLSLFQINFYGFLQEFILQELRDEIGGGPNS